LKSVMLMLIRHGEVKLDNKKALRKLLLYFDDVTEISPTSIRWDALKYHHNNASYRMLIGICRLAVKGLLLSTNSGEHRLSTWLNDGQMYALYEKFVLSYYQKHHTAYRPSAAHIEWDLRGWSDTTYLPSMKSDITLQNGERTIIIDTKFYESGSMNTNSQYGNTTFISGNMYQIYTYVKNKDKNATGNVAGVLLYAKTDEAVTPDDDFNIGGNPISIKTLDLNQDWTGITSQLEDLSSWLEVADVADENRIQAAV
jgi:5-methylcytosine-specific restriction enzyme subunit McrC